MGDKFYQEIDILLLFGLVYGLVCLKFYELFRLILAYGYCILCWNKLLFARQT
jgi:hypothetical protein